MVRTVNRAYSPAEKERFALRRRPPRPRKARPTLQFEEYLNMDANLIGIDLTKFLALCNASSIKRQPVNPPKTPAESAKVPRAESR
jgi:hypothetical protein